MDNPDKEPAGSDRTIEERIEQALIPKDQKDEEAEPEGEPEESPEEPDEEPDAEPETGIVEEELYEVEHEGKKARVPKELKDAFLRQADYTQKTQSVAEEKRQLAEERQIFQLKSQIESVVFDQRVELRSLISVSEQYEAALQQAVSQGDTQQLALLNAQKSILDNKINNLASNIRTKIDEQTELETYARHQRRVKADEEAAKRIPNFSAETKKDLVKSARDLGFRDDEIAEVDDPRVYQALWKAAQWDKLQSSKANVVKKVADAPKTLPAKGQSAQNAKSSEVKNLADKLRKTGRQDYAERLFELKLSGKR